MFPSRISCALLLALAASLCGCGTKAGPDESTYDPTAMLSDSTPFVTPGISHPPAVPAAEADIDDDAEVIGIHVDGQARAYLITAMSGMTTHVANDLVGDVPVSVTYCDRTDFARAFTSSDRGRTVDLGLQGWVDGEMSLLLNNQGYRHSSRDIPLADYPLERTTWGAWKQQHPETTLVVSLESRPQPSAQPAGTP